MNYDSSVKEVQMAKYCNERCGECDDEGCIAFQVNARIVKTIHEENHRGEQHE